MVAHWNPDGPAAPWHAVQSTVDGPGPVVVLDDAGVVGVVGDEV